MLATSLGHDSDPNANTTRTANGNQSTELSSVTQTIEMTFLIYLTFRGCSLEKLVASFSKHFLATKRRNVPRQASPATFLVFKCLKTKGFSNHKLILMHPASPKGDGGIKAQTATKFALGKCKILIKPTSPPPNILLSQHRSGESSRNKTNIGIEPETLNTISS